jgi:hypothetical protein
MARKRKRKVKGFRRLLFFIFTPVVVWLVAFVVWLYWNSITPLFRQSPAPSKPSPSPTRSTNRREHRVKEQISDEDRKKLDEILKDQTK